MSQWDFSQEQSKYPIHSAVILKDTAKKLFCTDGLSTADVASIKNVYGFGGYNISFVHCGVGAIYAATKQGYGDMSDKIYVSKVKYSARDKQDINDALSIDSMAL